MKTWACIEGVLNCGAEPAGTEPSSRQKELLCGLSGLSWTDDQGNVRSWIMDKKKLVVCVLGATFRTNNLGISSLTEGVISPHTSSRLF
jgi:hypothetical protein